MSIYTCVAMLCLSCTDAEAVPGAVYGQGTGPLLMACPLRPGNFTTSFDFVNIVPLGNCTTMAPDAMCSHERDVGVQCSPGQCKLVCYPLLSLDASL